MIKNITLCWSFRNRIQELKDSIESADITVPKDIKFLLVDANSELKNLQWIRNIVNKNIADREVRIIETHYRTTLPEAWNLGLMLSDTRYIIFISSDVYFNKNNWWQQIYFTSKSYEYILMPNHAVFCIDKKIIPIIGWFDENFKNGPHFDTDYLLRASEGGIKIAIISDVDGRYTHEDSKEKTKERLKSEVENRLPMNDLYNEKYFKSKWESDWPGWENASDPLNLPHPPIHIAEAKRLLLEIDPHPNYTAKMKLI